MPGFRDLSIRQKLTSVNMLAASLALLLACGAFFAYERITFGTALRQKLSVRAEILGYNIIPALEFNDPEAARSILSALRADIHTLSAGVYAPDGRAFAGYRRGGGNGRFPFPELPEKNPEVQRMENGRLFLFHRIVADGKPAGTIFIESDLDELDERVRRYAGIAALVFVASALVALAISSRMQRTISGPILHLAQTARAVTAHKNYSLRAVAQSRDELGLLVESFNEMLAQIQQADVALQTARNELERRVEERTRALQEEVRERKSAEVALERQAQELSRSNADLEHFAYVASHDLQEPLRMVASYTELLARRYRGKLDAEADEFIAFAKDGAVRMQALIRDLLTYSRLGRDAREFQIANCEEVVDRTLLDLRSAIAESGGEVTRGPLPRVRGNPVQLGQLFQNLIANALKFHGKDRPHVRVSAERSQSEWLFSVADNGIGVPPEHAERVFLIFQRLHGRTEYAGTGIGLSVCKKIVELHGGRIWVDPAPEGSGAVFKFTLPAEVS